MSFNTNSTTLFMAATLEGHALEQHKKGFKFNDLYVDIVKAAIKNKVLFPSKPSVESVLVRNGYWRDEDLLWRKLED